MRIISQPDLSEWSKELTCKKCTAVLEIEFADIKTAQFSQGYCEDPIQRPYVVCPVCNGNVTFDFPDLPEPLRTRAMEMKND